jgi:hypothetical protein
VASDPATASLLARFDAAALDLERLRRALDVLAGKGGRDQLYAVDRDFPPEADRLAERAAAWLAALETDADAALE